MNNCKIISSKVGGKGQISPEIQAVNYFLIYLLYLGIAQNPLLLPCLMIRVATSYVLTSIILLSQIGLPVHLHYCKGMLESVSVFFSQGCDDHHEVAELSSCCKKTEAPKCDEKNGDCCDDKVSILIQDIHSLIPQFVKWAFVVPFHTTITIPDQVASEIVSTPVIPGVHTDSGPPIYILHQSLIFYA
jgi:hypothetical protein